MVGRIMFLLSCFAMIAIGYSGNLDKWIFIAYICGCLSVGSAWVDCMIEERRLAKMKAIREDKNG